MLQHNIFLRLSDFLKKYDISIDNRSTDSMKIFMLFVIETSIIYGYRDFSGTVIIKKK